MLTLSAETDVGMEIDITEEPDEEQEADSDSDTQTSTAVGVQCELMTPKGNRLSVRDYETRPDVISYYTGFDNFAHYMLFFQMLGPATNCLSYQFSALEPVDQLFLTLMKLRQGKDNFELSLLFNISQSTIASIFRTWINFLYFQLREINIWPSREVVQQHMPEGFARLFGNTRVILDATEIPIAKPADVNAQSSTFSTYKNRNTLKTMIGCTPRGLISFIGDSYGGVASDRQLIERSSLCNDNGMFDSGDAIMADRGIMVQDLFASKDVAVNTPKMLKGKSRFEPQDIIRDRRIASKRIHVERVIGLSKTFKILKKELPASTRALGSRLIYVCFMLSNFRTSIVHKQA